MTENSNALSKCLQWACSPRGGNNFYGRVLNGCGISTAYGLNTCGVTIDKQGRYLFLWDPDWFSAQDRPLQILVVVHEAAHLILRHVERSIEILRTVTDPTIEKKLRPILNIAMDMAVNDLALRSMVANTSKKFKEYREEIIWPEDRDYPTNRTADEYFVMLLKDLKDHGWDPQDSNSEVPQQGDDAQNRGENQESGSGAGGDSNPEEENKLPDWFKSLLDRQHPGISALDAFKDATDGEINRALSRAKRSAQQITRTAVKQTERARGTVPGEIKSSIEALLEDAKVPWQEVLRGQLRSAISHKLDESVAYPNVALLHSDQYEPYPGYQKNFTFRILAAFDTSGSMSNDDYIDCCSELRGLLLQEDGISVRLMHFDHAIQHEEQLTTEDATNLAKPSRYGYGGTSFEEPLRYAVKKDTPSDWVKEANREDQYGGPFDLMLIFTDGWAPIPLPQLDPGIPLFWVLTAQGKEDPLMKRVLWMED